MEKERACPKCKSHLTRFREKIDGHPIYRCMNCDHLFQISNSTRLEDSRMLLVEVRKELQDIYKDFPGWSERLINVEGLINCGLGALYDTMQEMQRLEARQASSEKKEPPVQEAAFHACVYRIRTSCELCRKFCIDRLAAAID